MEVEIFAIMYVIAPNSELDPDQDQEPERSVIPRWTIASAGSFGSAEVVGFNLV